MLVHRFAQIRNLAVRTLMVAAAVACVVPWSASADAAGAPVAKKAAKRGVAKGTKKKGAKKPKVAVAAAATPKVEAKEETPKTEAPKAETPKAEPAKDDAPKADGSTGSDWGTNLDRDEPVSDKVPSGSRGMKPLNVDARLMGSADAILGFVGIGAGADVGVAKLGPGTLALGGAFEYDACLSACAILGGLTNLEFAQNQKSLWGRATYHLDIKGGKALNRFDIYPIFMVGPTWANSSVRYDGGAVEYRGKDTTVAVGAGAGINVFVAGGFFIGAEARARYARGTYTYELYYGQEREIEGSTTTWSTSGVDIVASLGFRF